MNPKRVVWPGSGPVLVTHVVNPECVVSTPQQCQHRPTTSSHKLWNYDQTSSSIIPTKLDKERLNLGNFPVDVTQTSRKEIPGIFNAGKKHRRPRRTRRLFHGSKQR